MIRSNWITTKNGSLINLDYFYAFNIAGNSTVRGYKTHNEVFVLGDFDNYKEAQEYIEYIKDMIIDHDAQFQR